jgi:hypothetical protein
MTVLLAAPLADVNEIFAFPFAPEVIDTVMLDVLTKFNPLALTVPVLFAEIRMFESEPELESRFSRF